MTALNSQLAGLHWLLPALWVLFLVSVAFCMHRFLRAWVKWRYQLKGLAYNAGSNKHGVPSPPPLPSQLTTVNQLVDAVYAARLDRTNSLVALEGRWGAGKSFIVQQLIAALGGEQSQASENKVQSKACMWEKVCCVHIDIWREQSEADLHLEVIENILSHPTVLATGFDYYPSIRIAARQAASSLSRLIPAGFRMKAEGVEAQLVMSRAVLPLMAQNDFEQVVGGLRSKGLLVVVILDELDRAIPAVTQAALALTQRSLHLPGVLVVMPFVRSQFRHKVFNPMFSSSLDLYTTFMAHVAHQAQQRRSFDRAAGNPHPNVWRPPEDLQGFMEPATPTNGASKNSQTPGETS